MKNRGITLFAVIALLVAGGPRLLAADAKPIRVLIVLGGCCHDYANQKDILAKGLTARANVECVIAYDPDKANEHPNAIYANPDWFKGFDVIIHDECTSNVKDLAFIDKVLK